MSEYASVKDFDNYTEKKETVKRIKIEIDEQEEILKTLKHDVEIIGDCNSRGRPINLHQEIEMGLYNKISDINDNLDELKKELLIAYIERDTEAIKFYEYKLTECCSNLEKNKKNLEEYEKRQLGEKIVGVEEE